MSILASLVRKYDRLSSQRKVPSFGYSRVEVGFCVVLRFDGKVAFEPIDLRVENGRRKVGPKHDLPSFLAQRTSGIKPNFLWDKTAYSLGVTGGKDSRTAKEHDAFCSFNREAISSSDDEGLLAFDRFLKHWDPSFFENNNWPSEMRDTNIVFGLEKNYRQEFLHDRPAAKSLWDKIMLGHEAHVLPCLVSGVTGRIADSHPPIKGVRNAQSSGAFLVSFNDDAYLSYGHLGGNNAQISERSAFSYTTALNFFLEPDSVHKIQVGDASTVFWADAADDTAAELAENMFGIIVGGPNEKMETAKVGEILKKVRGGHQIRNIAPQLAAGVRFSVLGLAPNAARLSIRYWFDDDFGVLAANYEAYVKDMAFEPWPANRPTPNIKSCVLRTAFARKDRSGNIKFDTDSISPLLSGELLRSILTGSRFPRALLAHLIMRIRSDHILDSIRIALVKGLLVRTMRIEKRLPKRPDGTPMEDYLVRSDPNDQNEARRLGRLFAVLERAQLAALGDEINSTIKDKFLGSACATPGQVMVDLITFSRNHTKRLRNGHSDASWIATSARSKGVPLAVVARRVGASLDRDIGRLTASFAEGFSQQHSSEEQGLFLVGYYQERFGGRDDPDSGGKPEIDGDDTDVKGEE